jgi:hypothetical protein
MWWDEQHQYRRNRFIFYLINPYYQRMCTVELAQFFSRPKMETFKEFPSSSSLGMPVNLVRKALEQYACHAIATEVTRVKNSFASISADDAEWIRKVQTKLVVPPLADTMTERISKNDFVCRQLSEMAGEAFSNDQPLPEPECDIPEYLTLRVRSLLLHMARDWSGDSSERDASHTPILASVSAHSVPGEVLVIDSGLGRLAYDIARTTHRECVMVESDPFRLVGLAGVTSVGDSFRFHPYVII